MFGNKWDTKEYVDLKSSYTLAGCEQMGTILDTTVLVDVVFTGCN